MKNNNNNDVQNKAKEVINKIQEQLNKKQHLIIKAKKLNESKQLENNFEELIQEYKVFEEQTAKILEKLVGYGISKSYLDFINIPDILGDPFYHIDKRDNKSSAFLIQLREELKHFPSRTFNRWKQIDFNAIFNRKKKQIEIGNIIITLDDSPNQLALCRAMFQEKVKVGQEVNWETVYYRMFKIEYPEKKEWLKVYYAVLGVNKKVQEALQDKSIKLFKYKNKAVILLF